MRPLWGFGIVVVSSDSNFVYRKTDGAHRRGRLHGPNGNGDHIAVGIHLAYAVGRNGDMDLPGLVKNGHHPHYMALLIEDGTAALDRRAGYGYLNEAAELLNVLDPRHPSL